jgi:hypothetical protein
MILSIVASSQESPMFSSLGACSVPMLTFFILIVCPIRCSSTPGPSMSLYPFVFCDVHIPKTIVFIKIDIVTSLLQSIHPLPDLEGG